MDLSGPSRDARKANTTIAITVGAVVRAVEHLSVTRDSPAGMKRDGDSTAAYWQFLGSRHGYHHPRRCAATGSGWPEVNSAVSDVARTVAAISTPWVDLPARKNGSMPMRDPAGIRDPTRVRRSGERSSGADQRLSRA
jgi:hypothetical protein